MTAKITEAGRLELDRLRSLEGLDPSKPWGGRSPRALTKAHMTRRFSREAAPLDEFFDEAVINEQYRRFQNGS